MMLFHTGGAWTASTDATWLKVKKESGTGGDDFVGNSATPVDQATVDGFCTHNQYKTEASGTLTDYIEFTYSRTGAPGYHFKAVGFKYTGWTEDEGY